MQRELNVEMTKNKIIADLTQLHTNLINAQHQLKASEMTLYAQKKSYEYGFERYKLGVINIFDLNNEKTKKEKAQFQYLINKYNFLLKMKILEIYLH
jgi:outer membrane protein